MQKLTVFNKFGLSNSHFPYWHKQIVTIVLLKVIDAGIHPVAELKALVFKLLSIPNSLACISTCTFITCSDFKLVYGDGAATNQILDYDFLVVIFIYADFKLNFS